MIALTFGESWLLIAVAIAVAIAYWKILDLSAEAFSAWWHDRHEDVEPGSDEPGEPPIGGSASASR